MEPEKVYIVDESGIKMLQEQLDKVKAHSSDLEKQIE